MKTLICAAVVLTCLGLALAIVETRATAPAGVDPPRIEPAGEMSVERAAHQATLLANGQVLITGGCGARGCNPIHTSAEIYDPAAGTSRAVASMATPRVSHAAAALPDGRVIVFGGWTGQGATALAEIYDPANGRWTPAGEMSEARMGLITTRLRDGRLLISGGQVRMGTSLDSAEIFDPATATFFTVGPMQTPRSNHAAVTLADGRVLISGGFRARGEVLRSAEVFDPTTGTFQPTGNMLVPRAKHAAALLPDGKVLIIGGSDERDYQGRYHSTEIYDPATGEFSPGPDMRWARHKIRDAVVSLPSGAVLVAGGATTPELYDPDAGVFASADGSLSGPQMFATATLMPAGGVLVLGGYDDRIQSSASAWLVRP